MAYYVIKHGTFLADIGDWWNTWIDNAAKAKPFWDKSLAESVAETLEGSVVARPCAN